MPSFLLALMTGMVLGAAPPARLTPEQRALLPVRTALVVEAREAARAGDKGKYIAALEKILQIEQRLVGRWHRLTRVTAGVLSRVHRSRGEWEKEARYRRLVLEAFRHLDGADHWRTQDARLALSEALAQPKRTPMQRETLVRARKLAVEANALVQKGEPARAIPLAQQAAKLQKDVQGENHPAYALSLKNLGVIYRFAGQRKAARPAILKALEITRKALGERHPQYAGCSSDLAELYEDEGDHRNALLLYLKALKITKAALGEQHSDYSLRLNNLAVLYQAMGKYEAALLHFQKALRIAKETVGEKHIFYARTLNNLGVVYKNLGDHKAASARFRKAQQLLEEGPGKKHPFYGQCLNDLASLHMDMGEYKAALPLARKALQITRESLGERHLLFAVQLNNLGMLYQNMGDYKSALPVFQEAIQVLTKAGGRKHPHQAIYLSNLAGLYNSMGDYKQARRVYEQALELAEEALGKEHPHYGAILNNLATASASMGDHKAAISSLRLSLENTRRVLGEKHPRYATGLQNLGGVYMEMGDCKVALDLFAKALRRQKEVHGERHPSYATILENLAVLHQKMGDYEKALSLANQARATKREALGRKHPHYAANLHNLAGIYTGQGRYGAALLVSEQALALARRQQALDASVQSERQQRAATKAMRNLLDLRLSIPDESAQFSHNHVLAWKGAAFAAQQARRRFVLAKGDLATRSLALQLHDMTRSLALLAARQDNTARKRAEGLAQRKEALEVKLAQLSSDFRLAVKPPTSEAFRKELPPGTVLLDFLVHTGSNPAKPRKGQKVQRRLVVWVVRPDAPTLRIGLGPMGPIEKDIQAWRKALQKGSEGRRISARLREKVWAPLEKHLSGAKVVLLSPDEAIGRLPFAALPGREKGKVLLEEVRLALLPIPQVLPQVLERPASKPTLLTLGGVEYGDGPGAWNPLLATVPEVKEVGASYQARYRANSTSLTAEKATEGALVKALPLHRFAHLATHGFFAPPTMRSFLDRDEKRTGRGLFGREGVTGWHPGLLSGLVLAGANNPKPGDDGILTASEVAEMNLSGVELAVLSACQTGLGKEAAGEGMLGLQRAFALAGCKTAVTSLWSVHDGATSVLMDRFYHHLWEKKSSKLEALRQAQLDVMRHPEWVEKRLEEMAGLRGLRGIGSKAVRLIDDKKQSRSPSAWWAAWQLSGDWR